MPIGPVCAPAGTVAVTSMSESTENCAGFLLPNPTPWVCVRLPPLIVTTVPTGPLIGLNPVIVGVTRNLRLLFSVPEGVVTVTYPVVAPVGTTAVKYVPEETVKLAEVPLNETFVVPVKP